MKAEGGTMWDFEVGELICSSGSHLIMDTFSLSSFVWPFQNIRRSALILNKQNEHAQISANAGVYRQASLPLTHPQRRIKSPGERWGQRLCDRDSCGFTETMTRTSLHTAPQPRLDNRFISHCLDPFYHFHLHCLSARVRACMTESFYQSTSWAEK